MIRSRAWSAPLLLVVAGVAAWANAFHGPFIFDDLESIPGNPSIRHLWPPWDVLVPPLRRTVAGRPFVNLTLAVNYALGGLRVEGYHAFNLVVHVANGLLLWALLRRTLARTPLRDAADGLATAAALLWLVHPLATDAVTYVIQRCELLMAFFLLLTLYCVARGWSVAAVVACALGMASKEVMVVAPLLALAYDRIFLARSFGEVFRRRWPLHAGLAATWLLLAALVAATPHQNTGFGYEGLGPVRYAATQLGVVAHYLRLALWPRPLVIDYLDWPLANGPGDVVVPAAVLLALAAATVWALVRHPASGFLGLWFFLILAPTSSILPSRAEIAAERRMYLPLAAVIAAVVVGVHVALRRVPARVRRVVEVAGIAVAALALAVATHARNADYASVDRIWSDALAKRPQNVRAHINLGAYLEQRGDRAAAARHFDAALRLAPANPVAHYNLGLLAAADGKPGEAVEHYTASLAAEPSDPKVHYSLAVALTRLGRTKEAIEEYRYAIRLAPRYGEAHNNLGNLLSDAGRTDEAMAEWTAAVRANPDVPEAQYNLGAALAEQGRTAEAVPHLEAAVRLRPGFEPFRDKLEETRNAAR